MASSAKPGIIIFVCGILGLIMAAILQLAYDSEYVITMYITEAADLPGLQIVVVILFLLIGGVLAAITSS
jgi:hypothetical protein